MTIKELHASLAKKTGLQQKQCEAVYSSLIELIEEQANEAVETKVVLPKLGTIKITLREEHLAKNPKTKEEVIVAASRRASLSLFPTFKERLNTILK